jgi:hypothetical protein
MNYQQNKLIKNIEKKCTTIMIGALARFEEKFGHLWEEEGDPKADAMHELWQETRHNVLNFGNHNIRTATEDLYRYFIKNEENPDPVQYRYNFNLKGEK